MRILVATDIHYSLKQLDWLCTSAGAYDLLVIAGDLLDLAGHADLDTQTIVVEKYLRKMSAALPLAVCSGNHDLDAEAESGERFAEWMLNLGIQRVVVDHQGLSLGDCRISVCPWWEGPASRDAIADFLQAESAERRGLWMWIYHAPPDGARTSWNGKDYAGDAFLAQLIREHQPDIVVGGHIHNSPFRNEGCWHDRVGSTRVFNAGRQLSAIPAVIVLDLAEGKATWHSDMDVETVSLTD